MATSILKGSVTAILKAGEESPCLIGQTLPSRLDEFLLIYSFYEKKSYR
uniref:Uncharacterized protein n=1 Tax=Bartonella ancashensis TaxID=1318743 RepID=A0A1V0PNF6_9HYPH|nr:hypothetical protein [Bartonella ancashensis]